MTEDEESQAGVGVLNNPAARLNYWLSKGRRLAKVAADEAQRSGNRPREEPYFVLDVWSKIWDLNAAQRPDRLEYHRRAIGMIDAGVEVRALMAQSTNPVAGAALDHFHEVESALNFFMEAPTHDINAMMGQIQGTGWQSLKLLDRILATELPQPVMDFGQIAELIQQTNDLISGVAESDLSEADRLMLTTRLQEVVDSLTRARITGTATVVSASDGLTGALVRLQLRGLDVMNHPVTKAIWALTGALWIATGHLADLSEIASGPLADLLSLPAPTK